MNKETYLSKFEGKYCKESKAAKALELALEIRKFEIELYWKRATYFWTFIAASFAGYGLVYRLDDPVKTDLSVLLGCLGLIFSYAWYCINRGSKYWQANWETHVDILEENVLGPLYKVIAEEHPSSVQETGQIRHAMTGAKAFSVSKINQIISVFVTFVWILLIALPLVRWPTSINWVYMLFCLAAIVATIVACIIICFWGRTSPRNKTRNVILVRRRFAIMTSRHPPHRKR